MSSAWNSKQWQKMWQRMVCLVRWKRMCTLLSSRSMDWNNGEDKIYTAEKSRSIHIRWNSSTPIEPKLREVFGRMMIRGTHSVMNLNMPCVENGERSKKFPKPFLQNRITEMSFFCIVAQQTCKFRYETIHLTADFVCHAGNWWLGTFILRVWSMPFTESHSAHFLLQLRSLCCSFHVAYVATHFVVECQVHFFTIVLLYDKRVSPLILASS